jgi:hypothetical protein
MAGLCHLLLSNQSSSKLDAHAYLEQAMSAVYSNGLRVSQFDSTKAIIFYYEVHIMMGDFRSAPLSLIRTANVVSQSDPSQKDTSLTRPLCAGGGLYRRHSSGASCNVLFVPP